MTISARTASDAELILGVRVGDRAAGAELRLRHEGRARALADCVAGPGQLESTVDATFAAVLRTIAAGGSPDAGFGLAVLYTMVQRYRPGVVYTLRPPVLPEFRQLPERWQAVLWHLQVELMPATEVAVLLGIPERRLVDLARAATSTLVKLHLGGDLDATAPTDCSAAFRLIQLGHPLARSTAEEQQLAEHLDGCPKCREGRDVATTLRCEPAPVIARIVLGEHADGYLTRWDTWSRAEWGVA